MSSSSNSGFLDTDSSDNDDYFTYNDRERKSRYPSYSFYESLNFEEVFSFSDENYERFRFMLDEDFLIAATIQNNIDLLKQFSHHPDKYNSEHSEDGNSLLQIAIRYQKKEACDYLFSTPNLSLEHENKEHVTALGLALRGTGDFHDTISYELIKKGASLNAVPLEEGDTVLHQALKMSLVKVSKLLIDMGYDVNAMSNGKLPPLWSCLQTSSAHNIEKIELVTALLSHGADPTIVNHLEYNTFEYAVQFCSYAVAEVLFYYIFDRYTCIDMHFEVLLKLADEKSPFFHEAIKHTDNVILGTWSVNCHHLLFLIDIEYLNVLIQKCDDVITQALDQVVPVDYKIGRINEVMSLRNLNVLLESHLRDDIINFIVIFGQTFDFFLMIGMALEESVVVENVCYLLSYGLRLNEIHLSTIYRKYRYGELLKIVLHMDIEKIYNREYTSDALLILLYDVNMTLDKYLQDPYKSRRSALHELFPYFAHPKLQKSMAYYEALKDNNMYIPSDQPKVPLLVELARNVFRSYFVKRFNIKSAKQFYALINGLPIGPGYKKIITYETKLY